MCYCVFITPIRGARKSHEYILSFDLKIIFMSTKETTTELGFSDYLVRTLPHSVYTAVTVNGELTLSVPVSSIKEDL